MQVLPRVYDQEATRYFYLYPGDSYQEAGIHNVLLFGRTHRKTFFLLKVIMLFGLEDQEAFKA